MNITKQLHQGTYDITFSGKFTFSDHAAFRDVLQHISENGTQQITLHMQAVEFVDSAALGMLLLALDESQKHRKRLVISGASGQVKKMFDMAKFNTLFALT